MTENTKRILITLSVAMICNLSSLVQAEDTDYEIIDPNEVPNVLLMLAAATKSNYEKINTWQGQVSHATINTTRGEKAAEYLSKATEAEPNESINEIQRLYSRTIEFKIDVENNRFYSFSDKSTEPYTYIDTKKGKTYSANRGPEEQIFLVTSGHEIEIFPSRKTMDGVVLNRFAIKFPPRSTHITDPRNVFYMGNKTLWLTLSQFSQYLQISDIEKGYFVIKKKFASDHTTYRIEISEPGLDHPTTIMLLSSEVGFNCTYTKNWYDDGSLMSEITTEFVNFNGVFLPKEWGMSQYYPDGDGGQAPASFMVIPSWHSAIPYSRGQDLLFWPIKGIEKQLGSNQL